MAWSRQPGSPPPAEWSKQPVEALVVGARHEPRPCRPPRRLVVARIEAERREAQCESRHLLLDHRRQALDDGPVRRRRPSNGRPRTEAKAASPGSRVLDAAQRTAPRRRSSPTAQAEVSPFVWRWSTPARSAPRLRRRPRRRSGGSRAGPDARATGRSTTSRGRAAAHAGPGRRPGRGSRPGRTVARPRAPHRRAGAPAPPRRSERGDPQRSSACANGRAEAVGSPITGLWRAQSSVRERRAIRSLCSGCPRVSPSGPARAPRVEGVDIGEAEQLSGWPPWRSAERRSRRVVGVAR